MQIISQHLCISSGIKEIERKADNCINITQVELQDVFFSSEKQNQKRVLGTDRSFSDLHCICALELKQSKCFEGQSLSVC